MPILSTNLKNRAINRTFWDPITAEAKLLKDCLLSVRISTQNGEAMGQRLQLITDWPARAHAANYCVHSLAENCGVSARTLDRHIKLQFGICPKEWLRNLRMRRALELLMDDTSVKETALTLGYRYPNHFSREFKKHTGHPPSRIQAARRLHA
jgi:AraC-like DNA-binding protein